MDVLSDILASLRLTGGVVIDGQLCGDFCLRSEFTPDHCAPFFPMPETLIGYHYVRSGRMIVEVDGLPPSVVGPGEVAILPRNDPHLLSSHTGLEKNTNAAPNGCGVVFRNVCRGQTRRRRSRPTSPAAKPPEPANTSVPGTGFASTGPPSGRE